MAERWAPKKPHFGQPPAGYVPGLGRGAVGFVTRSDIGPSRVPAVNNINTNQVDEDNYQPGQFDSWEGEKGALFAKGNLDEEDKQAEDAYDFCEKRLWERGEKKRKQAEAKLKSQSLVDNSITGKFVDLKRQLAKVSNEEWQTIPDCVDMSIKKRKKERYAPVPDNLILNVMSAKEGTKAIDPDEEDASDFRQAKETLLKSKLDNQENTLVSWQSNVDKIGYITELNTNKIDSQLLADTKRARMLYKSALASNPKNPDVWLAAARVEENDGKIHECRNLLRKAVQNLPLCEDLWKELSRVESHEVATDVLIEGLRYIPTSQTLWLYAARRQNKNKEEKSKLLRRGLQLNSKSLKLWKQLIQLQDVDETRKLLYKAVEALPSEIDLWLALAKSEEYKNAKAVINKARKHNPLNMQIWIAAVKLQEAQSKVEPVVDILGKIQTLLVKGRDILRKNGANISRDEWIEEAFYAEQSQSLIVCQTLVKISVGYGLTEEQIHNVLVKDVQLYEKQRQSNHTARFLYRYGVEATKSRTLMKEMIQFQNRKRMNKEYHQLDKTLKFSLKMFGQVKQFWKNIIHKLIKEGQYESALKMIQSALPKINSESEQEIRLLRVNIYMIQEQHEKVRSELSELREKYPKGESVFQSIRFEYEVGNYKEAWVLCQKSFKDSKSENIWKLAFRIKKKIGSFTEAHSIIERAVNIFPESISIWKDIIQHQIEQKHISKARALIDRAMKKLQKNQELYIISIELEKKFGTKKEANFALSKALQVFPKSPEIWAIAIELEPENTRKKKTVTAIDVCGESGWIYCSGGKLFWKENKIQKAKKWLEKALTLNPNNGDFWTFYIRFLQMFFPNEKEAALEKMMEIEDGFEGRKWRRVEEGQGGWKLQPRQILNILMKEVDAQIKAL